MCKTQGSKYSHHSLVEDELLNFIPIFRYQWTCHGCQDTPFLLLSFRAERQNGIDRPTYVVKILSTWEKKNVYFPIKNIYIGTILTRLILLRATEMNDKLKSITVWKISLTPLFISAFPCYT